MSLAAWGEQGIYLDDLHFYKHEQVGEDGLPQGFATSTGKLELANEFLESLGSTRLPEPVPVPLASTSLKGDSMPLTLLTGARKQPYWASSYFNNPEFRAGYPQPQADMSTATLTQLGIEAGEWVTVKTAHGEARYVANAAELLDGLVSVDYGWWFPEEAQGLPHLSGALRSNTNMLTSAAIERCEPLIGTWAYNGIPCVVEKLPQDLA
jgi:anaerobic selenocysteine-containing dehydrogenase